MKALYLESMFLPFPTNHLFTNEDSVLCQMTLLSQSSVDMDPVCTLSVLLALCSSAEIQAHRTTICRKDSHWASLQIYSHIRNYLLSIPDLHC